MYEVRVESDFAAAHFLRDYHGKCENLHGHNYKVYAHACGKSLNEGGMLLDFGMLKTALREVCKEMDHTNLNDNPVFDQNPSAERIAGHIYGRLIEKMKENYGMDLSENSQTVRLFAVDVFETETSRARFSVPKMD